METIKLKSGIKYRSKLTINGKVHKSPVFTRKYDCSQWLSEQKVLRAKYSVHGEEYKLHQKITLEEYIKLWIEGKQAQGIAKSTRKNYDICFRVHILPFFQNREMKSISKNEIETFQVKIRENHNP